MHENNISPCGACSGQGTVYLESNEGVPVQQIPCPFCHGSSSRVTENTTPAWMEGGKTMFSRWGPYHIALWFSTAVLLLTNNVTAWNTSGTGAMGPAWLVALHCVLWLGLVAAWVVWFKKRLPPVQHAPGFTDNREVKALGLFAAALAVRSLWDQHQRNQRNQQQW